MPIKNRGSFSLDQVFERQVNQDWPAANTDFDLYVQDLIASGNLIANGLIIRNIEVSDSILTGNITVSSITANILVLDIITSNTGIFENITINGDLTVEGNTVTLNTATLTVEDKNIRIANGAADAATADGAGITIDGAGANITYEASGDRLVINKTLNIQGDVNSTGNLIANGLIIRNIEVSDDILTGNISATTITANTLVLDIITANTFNGISTDKVPEGNVNLYFSNTRARQAFTAGKGIIIQENGLIKSSDDSDLYNLDINGAVAYIVSDTLSPALSFPGTPAEDRFILRSLQITNISDEDAYVTGNILYSEGNTAHFANLILIPVGSTLEFLKKSQVFQPNDIVNLQGFNASGTETANVLSAIITYETVPSDSAFLGIGRSFETGNINHLLYDSYQSYTILESLKLVNLSDTTVKTKAYWADANDNPKAYFAYNLPIPPNSSVELLQNTKRINSTDKIYINYNTNNQISAFLSGRIGAYFELSTLTSTLDPGANVVASYFTTEDEGTVLFYTVE